MNEQNNKADAARQDVKAVYRAAAFGDCVSILMQSPRHKHLPLETLRILVMPAIVSRQYLIAKVKPQTDPNAEPIPAGLVFWASVSEAIDARLRANSGESIRLAPDEWTSGDRLWLVDLIAPNALIPSLLKDLDQKVLAGRDMSAQIKEQDKPPRLTSVRELLDGMKS